MFEIEFLSFLFFVLFVCVCFNKIYEVFMLIAVCRRSVAVVLVWDVQVAECILQLVWE